MNKVQRMLGLKTIPNNTYMNDEQALHFSCAPDRKMVGPLGNLFYPISLKVYHQNNRLCFLRSLLASYKFRHQSDIEADNYWDTMDKYYIALGQATVAKMTVKKCRPFLP